MNIKDIFKKFVDVGNNADPTGTAGYMVDDISTANLSAANNAAAQTQKTVDSIKQSTSSILGGAPKLSLGGKTFGATPTVTSPLKQTTPVIPPKSTVSKKPVTPTYRVDPKERPKLAIKRNADKDKKDAKIPEISAFGAGDTKFTPDEPIKPIAPVSYYGAGSATQDIVTGEKTAPKVKSYSALADKGNADTSAYYSANQEEAHSLAPIVGAKANAGGTEDMLFPTYAEDKAAADKAFDESVKKAYDELAADQHHVNLLHNIEQYAYTVAGGADLKPEDFRRTYANGHDQLEKELASTAGQYGEDSAEYAALQQYIQKYEDIGRQAEVKNARRRSTQYSDALDSSLVSIYGGLMETDDYKAKAEAGRKALTLEAMRAPVSGGDKKTSGVYRALLDEEYISDETKDFLGYIFETEGADGVQQFLASSLGNLLTAALAGLTYAETIENDSEAWRGAMIAGNTVGTGMEHTITGSEAFYKGVTGKDKDDPTDMDLGGGYTISDATDNYLKQTLIGDMESDQFNMFSELGSSALATAASGTDWYKAFNKDASEYQKKAMGLLYYAFTSEYGSYRMAPADALAAIEEVWKGVGDYKQALWDSVKKGSHRVPVSGNDMLYSLYDEYLKLGDTELGGFFNKLSNGEVGAAQMLHQAGMTMSEQIIPMLMSMGVGGAFKALGAGKKATTWASRLASGLPMAMSIGGRSYSSALDEGADRAHALGYGISDAALEFVVGWFLDGAAGVGGKLTGGLRDKVIAKIASPLGRALADAGIRSFGEGLEEYIQEALAPVVDLWINEGSLGEALGEAFDPDNILDPDRLYAGFLGAFSALAMSPGNVAADIRNNAYYQAYGDAMKKADGLKKAADLILHNKPSGSDSDSEAYEAAKSTAEIIDKGGNVSDLAAGKMVADFAASGGDASMLANPATLSYTKESITEDDYAVGVASELLTLGEESGEETMQLAKDIAKLATGQEISAEAQARIDSNPNAQTVLEQINGDLDMPDNNNALTRAARMSVISGYYSKLSEAVQQFNKDKTIVTPAVQSLIDSGIDVKEAQSIGAVINKVLDGQTLTEKEAKLINAKNAAVRSTILAATGLNLTEYATPKMVMDVLNGFAKDVVRLKDSQAAIKKGAKQAAQARGAAMQGGLQNGIQGSNLGQSGGDVGSGQEGPQGAAAASGGVGASEEAPAHRSGTGQRSGQGQRNAGQVHGEVTEERKQDVKRKAVELGADEVVFKPGADSRCYYDPDTGRYVIQLRTDGQFTIEQYGLHEPVHLWITYALTPEHRMEVLDDFYYKFAERFGSEFCEKLFNFIKQVYGDKGYLASDATDAMYQIIEDMLSFCFAGQNYGMDLSACRQFAEQFVEEHGLKDIGTGNFSSPKVQEALANGWIDEEYYARRGWSEEDDGTTLDISTPAVETEQVEPEQTEEEKARERIVDTMRLEALQKMRKNLAKQRKQLVDRARTTGDNKKDSPNYEAHRAKVDALDEQLKVYDKRIAELKSKLDTRHSADYEEETNEAVNTRGVRSSNAGGAQSAGTAEQASDSVQKPKKDFGRKSARQLQESKNLHSDEVENIKDAGGEIVPDDQVPKEYLGIKESFLKAAPESEVTFYRDYDEDAPYAYVIPAIVKGADGGLFVNIAKLETGDWADDGWTLDILADHEKAHFWLDKAGKLSPVLWQKLRSRMLSSNEDFGKLKKILKAYQEWCSDFYHDAEEELLCDVFAGRSIAWEHYAPELWPVARNIVMDFFETRTEYGLTDESERQTSYSADYDPEYYQSIGLIDTDGSTASFTDNINGVHEDIINQLNGHPGEDVTDFIARGGVRVKPNYGIEINGKTALTAAQYDMIENIVANFSGDTFGIDFVIDGAHMNPEVFEGEDIDPNRVRSFLRNYYERRKADKARDEKLERYSDILGMPVKTMEDAYNLAQMMIQMEGPDPELQEIVDTYDQRRFSADYDELRAQGFVVENTPELDKMAEEFDSAEFLETGALPDDWVEYHENGGITDLHDLPITNDQEMYFFDAQSIDLLGMLTTGIIPLYLASDYIGFSAYDPSGKSDDGRSIFLTDDRRVGWSYAKNGKQMVDMKLLGALREYMAKELGYESFDDLPLPGDLAEEIAQGDKQAIKLLRSMYNALLSYPGKTPWVDRAALPRIAEDSEIADAENAKEKTKQFIVHARSKADWFMNTAAVMSGASEATDLLGLYLERTFYQIRGLLESDDSNEFEYLDRCLQDIVSESISAIGKLMTGGAKVKGISKAKLVSQVKAASNAARHLQSELRGVLEVQPKKLSVNDYKTMMRALAASASWAVYANTTNPLVLYGDEQVWNHLEDLIDADAGCDWADDFWAWYEQSPYKESNYQVKTRHIANYAYERGYDSAIITNIYDTGGYGDYESDRPSNIYVVFNPNQIKSVNNKHPSEDSRMNYSADYLNPESEDYLGPDLDPSVYENAAVDDAYRNKLWINENEEATEEELSETSLDADILDADLDAFLARLAAEKEAGNIPKERMDAIWAEYLEKQPKYMNGTKNAPAPEKTEAKQPVIPPAKKAEPETAKPAQTSPEKSELAELAEKIAAQSEDNLDPELLNQAVEAMNRGEAEYAKTLERTELAAQATVQAAEELKKSKAELEKKEQKLAEKEKPVIPPAEKSKPKNEAVVLKNDGTKFSKKDKNLNYARKIGKASSIEIRRRRNDRNTFDVRFNDGTGKIVAYEDVSPSALIKAFAYATGDKETAKQRAGQAMALASEPSLAWNIVKNEKIEKAPYVKPEEVRDRDNYGRRVPVKLTEFLKNSAIRTDKGALINVYRLAPANGVHNNKLNNKLSIYTERAAPINTMRGMTGAAAFGQTGKGVSEQLATWLRLAADPKTSPKELEKIRQRIVAVEKLMREYTNGVTRLDSNRPGFEFATPENAVNGKTLVEAYLDIRKPKVIDAKGKGVDFIRSEVQKFIRDPANKAGLFDADKNPVGPHDGFKFLNVRVLPEGETLGGGEADLDTAYVTLRNNQAKSTYNTAPTDSDFIQYSADYDPAFVIQDYGFNGGLRNTGIVRKAKPGELSDVKGNYISEEQDELFENAKVFDKNGNLRFGIIPLYHGSEHIHMFWDKSRAGKVEALFLSTNPLVSLSYAPNYSPEAGNVIDLMRYEKVAQKIADAVGLDIDSLSSSYDLKNALQNISDPDAQRDLAEMLALMYNAVAGEDIPEAWPMGGNGKVVDVKLNGGFDKEELSAQLRRSYDEALSIANDISDYVTDNFAPDLLSYLTDLESVLNSASDVFSALKYKGDADIRMAADFLEQNLRYIMDSYAGSVYDETGLKDEANRAIINMKRTLEDQMQYVGSTTVVYENGVEEDIQNLPDPLPQAGITVGYANTTDPFVVDGGHENWQHIDMRGHPQFEDFMEWKRTTGMNLWTGETSPYTRTDEIVQYAIDRGYNSVMIHDIMDATGRIMEIGGYNAGYGDVYIVFDSNQYKSVNNRAPTEDQRHNYSADYSDVDTGYTEGTLEDTILKIMMDKDEDRALAALAEYFSNFLQTGVLPAMENEKTPNIFQPRVSESQRLLLEERLRKDIDKYGRLEPGENPARNVFFPKRTDEGYVPRVYRSAAESKNIPSRTVPAIMREIVQNGTNGKEVVYQRITDKEAVAFANREMEKRGFDALRAEWQGKRDNEKLATKHDIAVAELVMIEAAKAGDVETTLSVMAELAEVATTAGQVVQAMRLIKSMPASYQLYYFQRVVNRLNRQYSKMINSKKMDELKIDRDKAKAVIEAKTQEELDKAVENLLQSIADQIPATMQDKWNAWRYLAMLGNPKTHIRNLFGNAIFAPAKFAKNLIAAGLESAIIRDQSKRNTSIKGLIGAPSEYREFAQKDYEDIRKDLQAGGKYNPMNEVMQKRRIFSDKTWLGRSVEWLSKANGNLLEWEDGWFLQKHYVNALTNFLATRGMSISALQSTPEGARTLNEARQYAFNEALKATYRDASKIASALNSIKKSSGVAGVLLDGVLPFTKTPINILKRGVEYSPVGLLNAITLNGAKLKNGDIDVHQFIDSLSAGLTGTGVALIGILLSSLGLLHGNDDDDDKKADADKLVGYQNYSIDIGGKNFTIDWAAPTALPLFVGNAIFNELSETNGFGVNDLINAITVVAEPLTQLSMLSGLNDAMKSAKWDENPLSSVVMSSASGYASQALPTFFAQIARSIPENRRTTYVDKNSDVSPAIQRWVQTNIMGKTPWVNNMRAEYIDAWGRKDTDKNGFISRLFSNMFAPWYSNNVNITSVDSELQRLSETTGTSVLMSPADRYIEFNHQKHNLTAEQYQTYAKVRGEETFSMLSDLFNSYAYQNSMTEEEKAKAVGFIKEYGNILGKQAVFPEYESSDDNWAEKCDGDTSRLMTMALAKAQASEAGITAGNNSNFYNMVLKSSWMAPVDKAYVIAQQYDIGTTKEVYVTKKGPHYELTPERKERLYEHYRMIFPAYYLELVQTQAWQNADAEKRLDMLADLRKQVNGINKAWLAEYLYSIGAAQITG